MLETGAYKYCMEGIHPTVKEQSNAAKSASVNKTPPKIAEPATMREKLTSSAVNCKLTTCMILLPSMLLLVTETAAPTEACVCLMHPCCGKGSALHCLSCVIIDGIKHGVQCPLNLKLLG